MSREQLIDKVEKARATLEKAEAELTAFDTANNVKKGDTVSFYYGRGDTRRKMSGLVVGVRDEANGRWVAVLTGDGFDTNALRVRAAEILPADPEDAEDPMQSE